MPLADLDITQMLNDAIQVYVGSVNYDRLRSDCITVAPIETVAQAVTSRLDGIAAREIADKKNELTQNAHQLQKAQDASEEAKDSILKIQYRNKTQEHETAILGLKIELLAVEVFYGLHQVAHSGADRQLKAAEARVKDLQHHINAIESPRPQERHQHRHHNQHQSSDDKLARLKHELENERQHVSRLHENERREWAVFYQHELNRNRINTKISNHQSGIRTLSEEEMVLVSREQLRNQRLRASPMSDQALSMNNLNLLTKHIAHTQNETNATCEGMKQTARNKCYPTFLNQLNAKLSQLNLTVNQKSTLAQIITKMNEHLNDLVVMRAEQAKLDELEGSLQSNSETLTSKIRESSQLDAAIARLVNSNETLSANLGTLNSDLKPLQERRNFYAKSSLAATVIASAGSVSAYFLIQAGIIALIPALNMVVAVVVGVALLALITTALVAAVRTSFKQAEVADCEQTISNNNNDLKRNRQTLSQNQKTELPNLHAAITEIKQRIVVQTPITQQSHRKVASSLSEAESIQLINDYGLGNHPSTMFSPPAPSAPPFPMNGHEQNTLNENTF